MANEELGGTFRYVKKRLSESQCAVKYPSQGVIDVQLPRDEVGVHLKVVREQLPGDQWWYYVRHAHEAITEQVDLPHGVTVTLGRATTPRLVGPNAWVSRRHLQITRIHDTITFRDCSTHGSRISYYVIEESR